MPALPRTVRRAPRWALGLTAAAAVAVGFAAPAQAASYPPVAPAISVSAAEVGVGGSVDVHATGFAPASIVTVSDARPSSGGAGAGSPVGAVRTTPDIATTTASTSGGVTAAVRVRFVGANAITVAGVRANGRPLTLGVVVQGTQATPAVAVPSAPSSPLPLLPLAGGALAVLVVGAGALLLVARRRSASPPSGYPSLAPPQ